MQVENSEMNTMWKTRMHEQRGWPLFELKQTEICELIMLERI